MRFHKSVASATFAMAFFAMPIMAATATTGTSGLPNLSSVAALESSATAASTKTTTSSSTTLTGSIAVITGSSAPSGKASSTSALPTLPGAFQIPTPTVPPTSNAPFMQESNYPEGTVFIAVGAVLGLMALAVLVWHMMIAWALHRSVKRAARQLNLVDQKQLFQAPQAPFYKYADKDSTLSLGIGGLGGKSSKRRSTTGNRAPSRASLFFSPTALAGGNNPGNRASSYLPAGYYAAGAAVPGAYPGDRQSINMSNLTSQGYARHPIDRSPPGSPDHGTHSDSSASDFRPADGNVRAPSAYLDDLFDGEHPHSPPQQGRRDRRSARY
ncbi:hypothetical protein DSL72_004330 [Monilinia vaccinii-corymbosi]|uniref:Uncharacterized protein n=1 Tax=Monilinia vaccinii-corymbosi TaxID=61207 RepID=A0A8A3NZ05_9HELO|nr:hypothetical protein DSL72_004330 [Monilinia vaccinii-corymbosi]